MSTEFPLPPGYRLHYDADVLDLIAPNGKVVARFAQPALLSEIQREAREHSQRVDEGIARLNRLLGRPKRRGRGN